MAEARTLSEKVWDHHVVHRADGEPDLLYIDLHLVHEVTSPQAFDGLRLAGRTRPPPRPHRRHRGPQRPHRGHRPAHRRPDLAQAGRRAAGQRRRVRHHRAPHGHPGQGIVHVIGPEQGLTQPGMTIVCGDSHTSTHGAFGALAFGIGTSEVEHVLATQTLPQHAPGTMAVTVDGDLPAGVTAKDIILAIIGRIGTGGGIGSIIEYRGSAIRAPVDGGPHDRLQHVDRGRRQGRAHRPRRHHLRLPRGPRPTPPRAPTGRRPSTHWRTLPTDDGATFDKEVALDAAAIAPARLLGHQPRPGRSSSTRRVPDPDDFADPGERDAAAPGARVHGPHRRHAAARGPGRHRVHRLVHQRPHRGPAGRRRGGRGPHGEGRACGPWSCPARSR